MVIVEIYFVTQKDSSKLKCFQSTRTWTMPHLPIFELANSGFKSTYVNSFLILYEFIKLQNLDIWLGTKSLSMHLNTHLREYIANVLRSQCKLLGLIFFILLFKHSLGIGLEKQTKPTKTWKQYLIFSSLPALLLLIQLFNQHLINVSSFPVIMLSPVILQWTSGLPET